MTFHDNIAHRVSNFAIIIPSVLLLIVLCYAIYTSKAPTRNRLEKPSNQNSKLINEKQNSISININDSYICKTASISAFMKNKKVRVTNVKKPKVDQFLFDGNCVYSWSEGSKEGVSSCGYKQYISLYEKFGGSVDLKSIAPFIDSFKQALNSQTMQEAGDFDISLLSKSCIKTEKIDNSVFNLPTDIKFAEAKK